MKGVFRRLGTRSVNAGISGSLGGHPKGHRPLRYKNPSERWIRPQNHPHPPSFAPLQTAPPLDLRSNHYIVTMSFSGFPEFNIDDLTGFDNNSYGGDSFGFDRSNWDLPDVAGPSQHYSGADVQGGLNGYQDFPSPFSAPTSLYPIHGEFSNEGKLDCTSQRASSFI